MDLAEAIQRRRSVRRYQDLPVPDDMLRRFVEPLTWSPTASNSQELKFIFVTKRNLLENIHRFSPGLSETPPCLVVIAVDRQAALARGGTDAASGGLSFINVGIAAAYLLLVATDLGLGSCPVRGFHQGAVRKLLGLPEHVAPEMMVTIGYDAGVQRPRTRVFMKEAFHLDLYGNLLQ